MSIVCFISEVMKYLFGFRERGPNERLSSIEAGRVYVVNKTNTFLWSGQLRMVHMLLLKHFKENGNRANCDI